MTREKDQETTKADPKALVAMIDYMLPEVNQISPVAALHLCQVNAMLQQHIVKSMRRPQKR